MRFLVTSCSAWDVISVLQVADNFKMGNTAVTLNYVLGCSKDEMLSQYFS